MASVSVSQRRKTAYANAAAAKQRRQKILVIVGLVLLALILAYEVPHTLKLLKGSSPTAATPATSVVTPSAGAQAHASSALSALRRHAPVDPFSVTQIEAGVSNFGQVANPPGLRDPFAGTGAAAPPSQTTTGSTGGTVAPPAHILPKQIVIGQPGGGRVASHGWILILASIPTEQGRSSATTVAERARNKGLAFVSVLNSSNRRPLRGGYWVVYTGPYPSLGAVNSASTHVHASGFGDAYIRQLIVYKAKGK
jgi:hypothetical protein